MNWIRLIKVRNNKPIGELGILTPTELGLISKLVEHKIQELGEDYGQEWVDILKQLKCVS